MFQGQYYDEEIELAYNRFRYYDPEEVRYISQDPIGLLSGEFGFYNYVEDTNGWIDVFGLRKSSYFKNKIKRIKNKRGNKTVTGTLTRKEADKLGRMWVGENAREVKYKDSVLLISEDGLRQYRPPAEKGFKFSKTGVQANYQSRSVADGAWENNAHIDVNP